MAKTNGVTVNCITDMSIQIIGIETKEITKISNYKTLLVKQLSHKAEYNGLGENVFRKICA
jgi:hypothetical protein